MHTADAELITKVRLIRLGAATHSFDQNTRSMELDFIVGPNHDRIIVSAPVGSNDAPPGHYMLFIAGGSPNGSNPSPGRIVRLDYNID